MSIVYYYAKNETLPIYLKYGIRLSKNFDKELNLNGYQKLYLVGLLNPNDDVNKRNSSEYTCIKLDVLDTHLFVTDFSTLNQDGMIKEYQMIDKYFFGSYLKPRVLIDTSVISDKISVYNDALDIPLLYHNSEDFFYEVQIQKMLDTMPLKEAYEKLKM